MLWDSIDAIRAVAGPDYETAVVPEERRKYLVHYEPKSTHYEVVSTHQWMLGDGVLLSGDRFVLYSAVMRSQPPGYVVTRPKSSTAISAENPVLLS
jgi:hypothetical protein